MEVLLIELDLEIHLAGHRSLEMGGSTEIAFLEGSRHKLLER
jgi:hypothetical protein